MKTDTTTEQPPMNAIILKPAMAALLELGDLYIVRAGKVRHWTSHPDFNHHPTIIVGCNLHVIGVEDCDRYLCVRRSEEKDYLTLRKHLYHLIKTLGNHEASLRWEAECLAVGSADGVPAAREQEGGAAVWSFGSLDNVASVEADSVASAGNKYEL